VHFCDLHGSQQEDSDYFPVWLLMISSSGDGVCSVQVQYDLHVQINIIQGNSYTDCLNDRLTE